MIARVCCMAGGVVLAIALLTASVLLSAAACVNGHKAGCAVLWVVNARLVPAPM